MTHFLDLNISKAMIHLPCLSTSTGTPDEKEQSIPKQKSGRTINVFQKQSLKDKLES